MYEHEDDNLPQIVRCEQHVAVVVCEILIPNKWTTQKLLPTQK